MNSYKQLTNEITNSLTNFSSQSQGWTVCNWSCMLSSSFVPFEENTAWHKNFSAARPFALADSLCILFIDHSILPPDKTCSSERFGRNLAKEKFFTPHHPHMHPHMHHTGRRAIFESSENKGGPFEMTGVRGVDVSLSLFLFYCHFSLSPVRVSDIQQGKKSVTSQIEFHSIIATSVNDVTWVEVISIVCHCQCPKFNLPHSNKYTYIHIHIYIHLIVILCKEGTNGENMAGERWNRGEWISSTLTVTVTRLDHFWPILLMSVCTKAGEIKFHCYLEQGGMEKSFFFLFSFSPSPNNHWMIETPKVIQFHLIQSDWFTFCKGLTSQFIGLTRPSANGKR